MAGRPLTSKSKIILDQLGPPGAAIKIDRGEFILAPRGLLSQPAPVLSGCVLQ